MTKRKTKGTHPRAQPLVHRVLKSLKTRRALTISIDQPERDPSDPNGDWVCWFTIDKGEEGVIRLAGRGIDGLQALINALAGLRYSLASDAHELTWTGRKGHLGLPLLIQDDNPTHLELVRHLVEAEQCRESLLREKLREKPQGQR